MFKHVVLFSLCFVPACVTGDAPPASSSLDDVLIAHAPTAAAAAAAEAPIAMGVNPCTGWPGGLFGAVATATRDESTVSFHGGTWMVPLPVRPGQVLSDVSLSFEAPTGHAGDPTSVRVGLYSNGNALAFSALMPAGIGTQVAGDIPLNGRVVAPGELLELEFAPLDANAGSYAANDTQIDSVRIATQTMTLTISAPAFVAANPQHPLNYTYGAAMASSFEARASIPLAAGLTIRGAHATVIDSAADPNAKMALQLISINASGTNVIASSQVSNGDGSQQTLSLSSGSTVAPDSAYQLRVYALGVPSAVDSLWFASVDYN